MGTLDKEGLEDIEGYLETIANLAQVGRILIADGEAGFIPTILEDICEHSERLVWDYAVVKEEPCQLMLAI